MKKWVRRMGVLTAGLTLVGGVVTTPAAATEVLAWECDPGKSCFYDGSFGTTPIFIAPSEGCHTLSTTVANRISSVRNRGFGTARLYDRSPCTGTLLASVPEGWQVTLTGIANDRTNSIRILP